MNAPLPSGDFRSDPDYAAGQALHANGEALPVPASTALTRGYLDAMEPRECPDALWANGPGMREPFTERVKPGPPRLDEDYQRRAPRSIDTFGHDGKLLTPAALRDQYVKRIIEHCGGNVAMAARLLQLSRRSIDRIRHR